MTSLRFRPFHSGSFLGSAHDSCHISSFCNVFKTRWRNLKGLKLRLWFFLTYHGNFPEAIHLGEMSHTQKVTSMWATAICPLMGKTAPILCFHSRGQHLCKFIGTKESVYIRKEDWFGTPTWPPFHCFGTQIWPPWRHVKTHNCYKNIFAIVSTGGPDVVCVTEWIY